MRICLLFALLLASLARADDWPQWRGPQRTGISAEKAWLAPDPPAARRDPILWRTQIGKGHSAPAVVGDRLYILGWDGTNDTVFCLSTATGKVIWKQSYPCKTIVQFPGPRASPTVHNGAVYTLGQHGQLHAWAAADGKPMWKRQLPAHCMPDVDYGFAWSPLIAGDLLILPAGKSGLALRLADGTTAWGDDQRQGACASPVPYEHASQRGVALIVTEPDRNSVSLVGVDATTGRELFRHGPWKEKWGAACVDLLIDSGKVFVTTAEQHKRSARFTIDGNRLREDWTSSAFNSYTGTCVLIAGHVYGVSQRGILTCLDWGTGKKVWEQRDFGEHAALIAADGRLLIQTGKSGELVIAEASATVYRELRRLKVFDNDPKTFTPPVLAHGHIYCRSYAGEIACIDLRK